MLVDASSTDILENWVRKRNIMYIGERPIVENLMFDDYMSKTDPNIKEADRCTFVITSWPVISAPRAFAFAKGFPFYELFDSV